MGLRFFKERNLNGIGNPTDVGLASDCSVYVLDYWNRRI